MAALPPSTAGLPWRGSSGPPHLPPPCYAPSGYHGPLAAAAHHPLVRYPRALPLRTAPLAGRPARDACSCRGPFCAAPLDRALAGHPMRCAGRMALARGPPWRGPHGPRHWPATSLAPSSTGAGPPERLLTAPLTVTSPTLRDFSARACLASSLPSPCASSTVSTLSTAAEYAYSHWPPFPPQRELRAPPLFHSRALSCCSALELQVG